MTLEEQVASFRRSVRTLTLLVSFLSAAVVLLVAILWRGANEVRAHSFTLLDSAGRPAAKLKNGEGGPALTLFEPAGLVILGEVKGDIGLGVLSVNRENTMHLLLGRDGSPALSLSSSRTGLGLGVGGQTPAIIFKTDDKVRLAITDESFRTFDDGGLSTNLLPAMKAAADAGP